MDVWVGAGHHGCRSEAVIGLVAVDVAPHLLVLLFGDLPRGIALLQDVEWEVLPPPPPASPEGANLGQRQETTEGYEVVWATQPLWDLSS